MDWKLFTITFWTIFIAELGDKTQLSTILMASKSKKIWTVFCASSLALVGVTLLGVLFSEIIVKFFPPYLIKKTAAIAFIAIGILIFLDKI